MLNRILGLLGHLEVFGTGSLVDLLAPSVMAPDEPPKIRGHHRPMSVTHEEVWPHRASTMLRMTEVLQVDHELNEVVLVNVVSILDTFFLFIFFPEVAVV